MPADPVLAPAPDFSSAAIDSVGRLFAASGYDEAHLYPLLGNPGIPAPGGAEYGHVLHRTIEKTPLNALIRLFVLGQPLPRDGSIPEPEALAATRLIRDTGDGWAPSAAILPYDGLLIAFDPPHLISDGSAPADLVMAVAGSSLAVARSALRSRRHNTLDLGTGNGYLALLAARWSDRVVATDVSARSIEFARFNACLNRVSNVEFRVGDRFAPVEGERFHQILCNPPFAITPSSTYLYRDGGRSLDGFCHELAQTAPRFLEEDGVFQMVCDWAQIEGQDTDTRLKTWFENSGCDVLVMKDETRDPLRYAEEWVVETEAHSAERVEQLLGEWLDFYAAHQVSGISTGYVLMRRRGPVPPYWVHIEDAPLLKSGEFGDQLWRAVRAQEFLRTVPSDKALLRSTLRAAPNLLLRQEAEWHARGWHVLATRVRFATGLQREANVDQAVMGLVARCDGSRSLEAIVAEMSQALQVAPERLAPSCMAIVRSLVAGGFLLPQISRGAVN